jgi:lysyl-tRNA synthetase class II
MTSSLEHIVPRRCLPNTTAKPRKSLSSLAVTVNGRPHDAQARDGKASFCDTAGLRRIQVYINNEGVGRRRAQRLSSTDLGDIVWASGTLFKTKTGELSIHATGRPA